MRSPVYQRIQIQERMKPVLSILIPTLKSRFEKLQKQVARIEYQRQTNPVQLLWLGDNKSMTVGQKRNKLLSIADGEYICFVDDDDDLLEGYVNSILEAIKAGKKVITFLGKQTDNGVPTCDFMYGIEYGRNHKTRINGKEWKVMLPDHLCVWRRDIVTESFPDKQLGEDHEWARRMTKNYNETDQLRINEYLYHYNYNRNTTQCR